MSENINSAEAEKLLKAAFGIKCAKKDIISGEIIEVLSGHHKTYKYILVNGLLAKATNEKINAIALQAGAPIEGAYDARTLCHHVLVPFERDFLQNALGGSNEPFLNKPARFTHLSDKNAVRRGADKKTLDTLINIFNNVTTSVDAQAYLSCALDFLNESIVETKKLQDVNIIYNPTLVEIYEFILKFIERSYEGETCAIVVGTLEKIYYSRFSANYKAYPHKVNESGASSKEVGDIDIYKDGEFHFAIEVKDKDFTAHDVEHAFRKMQQAGGTKGQFIYGRNAKFDKVTIADKVKEFEDVGFMILLQGIISYAKTIVFKIGLGNKQEFIDAIMNTAIEINSKSETQAWIQEVLAELEWK